MAEDQARRPMSEEEVEEVSEAIRDQRAEIHAYLAKQGVDVDED